MAKKITDQDGNVYVKKKPIYKRFWFILLALIVIIIIVQQSTGNKQKDVSVNSNSSEQTEKAKYEVNDIKIESDSFTSYATGILKNNTDTEKSYVQVTIPVYDSNGNKVGEALANVNNLKANDTWKFKAIYLGSEKNVTFKIEELKVSGF